MLTFKLTVAGGNAHLENGDGDGHTLTNILNTGDAPDNLADLGTFLHDLAEKVDAVFNATVVPEHTDGTDM